MPGVYQPQSPRTVPLLPPPGTDLTRRTASRPAELQPAAIIGPVKPTPGFLKVKFSPDRSQQIAPIFLRTSPSLQGHFYINYCPAV